MNADQTIRQVAPAILDQLRTLDACTVSNAIERLDVRLRNEGFTDISVRCLSPGLPPMVGYAATGRIRTAAAPTARYWYYERLDWWEYLANIPAPRVIVLEDMDARPGFGALFGEIHAQIGRALECIGYVTNGAVRDLTGIERTGFHLFARGVSVSHAYAHVVDFGGPVEVGGLRVNPGDLLHWDLHGVVSVPAAIAGQVPKVAAELLSPWKSCGAISNGRDMHPNKSLSAEPLANARGSVLSHDRKGVALVAIVAIAAAGMAACSRRGRAEAGETAEAVPVGITRAIRMPMERQLTLSSELVPFQEIDVYAKESGYVRDLKVDYGTRVTQGQLMAVLEIPELQVQLEQDKAAIRNMTEQVTHAEHELNRVEAQHKVAHLQYDRLKTVADSKPGLVAQQEVDDWQGKDLALEAQVEASKSGLQSAQSVLAAAQARLVHDQVLYDYSRITAPFAGVVTERYANLGMLMQAGTSSSTQAMPLVKLSQDNLFRLVIPVPESDVRYIHVGDPLNVRIPSLNRTFTGKVARFSVDVKADTRTMRTEVDVPNPNRVLIEGMYAEVTLRLERKAAALAVPLEAVDRQADKTSIVVVDATGKIAERTVTLGMQNAAYAEVLSGLADGERVVVSDRSALKPGQLVRPKVVDALNHEGQS